MRLSAHEGDPGFLPWLRLRQQGKTVLVFLDGKKIEKVMTADEERGFVTYCKTDPNTGLMFVEDDEIATDIAYGTVKIVTEDG